MNNDCEPYLKIYEEEENAFNRQHQCYYDKQFAKKAT